MSYNVLCKGNSLEYCAVLNSTGSNNKFYDSIEDRHFSHYSVALMLRALVYCNLTLEDDPVVELVEQLYNNVDLETGLWSEDGTKEGVRYLYRTYEAIVAIHTLAIDSLSVPMHCYSAKEGTDFSS